MDTARQILRFSIPGAVMILHAAACYALFRRFQGVPPSEALAVLKDSIAGLVAATVPIGFIVYQAYFFNYRPVIRYWPLPWRGRFVRRDRAAEVFETLSDPQRKVLDRVFDSTIDVTDVYRQALRPKGWPCVFSPLAWLHHYFHYFELTDRTGERKQRQKSYENRWYGNWNVLRGTLDISETVSGNAQFKSEYTSLSDIYHSLGAARTAVSAAWLLVISLALSQWDSFWGDATHSLLGLVAVTFVTAGLWYMLHTARRHTWHSASSTLALGLRWLLWKHAKGFDPDVPRSSMTPK